MEKEYLSFLCPNCRAIADLEREIEEDEFDNNLWEVPSEEQLDTALALSSTGEVGAGEPTVGTATVSSSGAVIAQPDIDIPPPPQPTEVAHTPTANVPEPESQSARPTSPPLERPGTQPVAINGPRRRRLNVEEGSQDEASSDNGSSGGETGHEGPMTPMNDAGPFMLDGGPLNRRETLFMPLVHGAGTPP